MFAECCIADSKSRYWGWGVVKQWKLELNLEVQTPPMYLLSTFIETDPIGDYLSSNSKRSNNLSFREELYEPTFEDSHWKG